MSENNNSPEFTITTSREYWEQKVYEEIKESTYINPLYDAGFKAFLGEERALTSFLNGVFHLGEKNRIEAVTLKNVEVNILFPATKTFRLDIRATTVDGRCIDVEMQKAKPAHFIERVLLQHSAFMLQGKYELDKDYLADFPENPTDKERLEREERRYEIPPTIAIWVCDFKVEGQDGYFGTWTIRNEKGLTVTDKVKYIMYDLTQFDKTLEQVKTIEDRWLYLLKHAGKADSLPDFGDKVIASAINRLLVKNASEKLLREQAANMVMTEEELDYLASLRYRARTEGHAEGHAEGLAEGRAEGLLESSEQTALEMLANNEPIEKIVRYSHLPEERVLELRGKRQDGFT